jgi:hypothetical protein
MPVVACASEALGRDGTPLGEGTGLVRVEDAESDGLLNLDRTVKFDVDTGPEVVERGLLLAEDAVPSGVERTPAKQPCRH